ncbi:MAG: hypothetical protein ABSF83_03490 [Nitrososphaerales archaeon]|jgi:hypothetical protein
MAGDERYAERWHGLFPRFVLASLSFALVGVLFQIVVALLVPIPEFPGPGPLLRNTVLEAVSIAFFPFAAFVLFYLSSRVRVDLGKDFAGVAASIFLGALLVFLVFSVPEALGNVAYDQLDNLVQSTASVVWVSIEYAFVGFVAVLVSYRRRMT